MVSPSSGSSRFQISRYNCSPMGPLAPVALDSRSHTLLSLQILNYLRLGPLQACLCVLCTLGFRLIGIQYNQI